MVKQWLLIYFILNVIVFSSSADYKAKQTERERISDVNELFKSFSEGKVNPSQLKRLGQVNQLKLGNIDGLSERLMHTFSKCFFDLLYTSNHLTSQWALQLFDSFGKPESGILNGNYKWVGDYNQCLNVRATNPNSTTVGNFRGKYCSVSWSMTYQNSPFPVAFLTGVCIPDSCSAKQIGEYAPQLLSITGISPGSKTDRNFTIKVHTLNCPPIERHFNGPAKAVIAVLSIFVALTVLGSSVTAMKYIKKTIIEHRNPHLLVCTVNDDNHVVFMNGQPEKKALWQNNGPVSKDEWFCKLESFLDCFCIFTNSAKLFDTDTSEGELSCIHGIRFFSMCWIILGHTYMFTLEEIKNILEAKYYIEQFLFQIVVQGVYAVDSFFVMSGLLLAYLTTKEFTRTKRNLPWHLLYLHRYVRLTPLYMLIAAFSGTVYFYLGFGPYWPSGDIDQRCARNWWKNMLYINNFDPPEEQCVEVSWYLSNDMQFFVISPLFMIALWRWQKMGYSLIASVMMACWLCCFCISYHFEFEPTAISLTNASPQFFAKFVEYHVNVYTKPYIRIDSYLVGIITGYILFKRRTMKNPKHSWTFLCVGWATSCVFALSCIFGLYGSRPSLWGYSFYNALNRSGFSMSVAWVIYVCLIGQGGFVNSILSWKLIIPFSRLTYCVYLIHPLVLRGYLTMSRIALVFGHLSILFSFVGLSVLTFVAAMPVALILEYPLVSLGKLLTKGVLMQEKAKGSD